MTTRTARFSLAPLALLATLFGCDAEPETGENLRSLGSGLVPVGIIENWGLDESDFMLQFERPTSNTPIDVTLEQGTLMSFGRHYFSFTEDGVFPPIGTQTQVERVEFGDVFAVVRGGVVRRYLAIGVDAQGQLVALNQAGVAAPASELLRRVPTSLLPHPGKVADCVARVEAEASACVDESGSSWCASGQAEAIRACMLDLSGGQKSLLVNNELLEDIIVIVGALECETRPFEFVDGLAIEVNGEPCTFSGWTFSSWGVTAEGNECGIVADLSTHYLVCPGVAGGDLGAS